MFELIDFLIVNPIINILFVVYNYIGDFGLAVIIFTVVIKLATWPLVKKQYHQTKLMKKIQPELVEIRKRANGNKQLESLEMMNLYKKHNIKPMASIWSLLIQLPIFFALFFAVRVMVLPSTSDNVEKRAYPVVAKLERIDEVTPKYALLGTHAGRRTFICNALALGIPPQVVMKWTGHSDYKAIKPYIDIADDIKANAMSKFNQL